MFSGRIDQQRSDAPAPERWHIGRRHVADSRGDPVVVDWRADVSTAFYRASRTEPMGVSLRRRFGIDRGQLNADEDERLAAAEPDRRTGLRRLYVVLTRAVSALTVTHADELPVELTR
ncbi:MAG: hypothetical protein ACYDDU_11660 [Dermatophilaceae bacterium]